MRTNEETPLYSEDGRSSRSAFSEDGRGGIEPTPQLKAGIRYVYYRLYTKGGPLESINPIYSNDRFISRILSPSVRPPHTIASVKRYLCKIEGLASENCTLYRSLTENIALEDSTRLSLRGTPGPGSSVEDPIALVSSNERQFQVETAAASQELLQRNFEQRYVYYRIYDEQGETISKTSFDQNTPCLGRVNTLAIPPPHTVASLKNHVIESENILAPDVQIFEDEDGESPMNDTDTIALLSDSFPGCMEDQPMAVTYDIQGAGVGPSNFQVINENPAQLRSVLAETREELRKAKEELERLKQAQPNTFTRKLKATRDWNLGDDDNRWHSIKMGDIFHTDGVLRKEEWKSNEDGSIHVWGCYLATNSAGRVAFAIRVYTSFC